MITKEEAKAIAINYIEERDRDYTVVKEPSFRKEKNNLW